MTKRQMVLELVNAYVLEKTNLDEEQSLALFYTELNRLMRVRKDLIETVYHQYVYALENNLSSHIFYLMYCLRH